MTTQIENDLSSLGQIAAHTQQPVRRLAQVADTLGLEPKLKLNGMVFFSADQVERLTEAVNNQGSK